MGIDVDVQLLGPLRVRVGTDELPLRGLRQRRLLAALALDVTRVVSMDRLVDVVWPVDAPPTARRQIQDLAGRLRRDLTAAGCPDSVLTTHPSGYALSVPATCVDVVRFRQAVTSARVLRPDDPGAAHAMLGEALRLWRDDALAGLACPALESARVGLDELHLVTWEQYIDVALDLGRHEEVLSDVAALVEAHPLREGLVTAYMLALYRVGRAHDALRAFHRLRERLGEELGPPPGPEAQHMHEAIIRDDPGLAHHADAAAPAVPVEVAKPKATPRQLPREPRGFVGRAMDLRALERLALPGTITAISGMSGVGKTALALRWAHANADRFPDGQLHVDLRGYDTAAPMTAIEALTHLVRSLGHPPGDIPADEPAATALYRTLLADRRALILLDNARSAAQVRPLLPGSAASAVLVTSRDTLTGLLARDGARLHTLDVLTSSECVELMRGMLGAARVDAEPEAAVRLGALVGHLTLAVRILAAHLAVSPQRSVAAVAESLAGDASLDALTVAGDPEVSVRRAFDHSYRCLAAEERRLLRLLGLVPGADVTAATCGALLDAEPAAALAALTAAHLVEERTPGRFGMHDLVRAYAHDKAMTEDAGEDRSVAVARLLDWYADHARAARTVLFPGSSLLPHPARHEVSYPTEGDARAFLDAEADNIVATLRTPRTPRDMARTCVLAEALTGYFWLSDYGFGQWLEVATIAATCAEQTGDARAGAAAQISLAKAYTHVERTEQAVHHARAAVTLARQCGWLAGEAISAGDIGEAYLSLGRYAAAAETFRTVAATNRRAGRPAAACGSLVNAGIALLRLGQLDDAVEVFRDAIAGIREYGPRWLVPMALQNLAMAYHHLGQLDLALATIDEALAEHHALGQRGSDGEARAYDTLAAIHRDQGHLELALAESTRSLDLLLTLGSGSTANVYNTRGSVLCRLGRVEEAVAHHERAQVLAVRERGPTAQAEALLGLAAARAASDRPAAAAHVRRALAIAREWNLKIIEIRAAALLATVEGQAAGPADMVEGRAAQPLAAAEGSCAPEAAEPIKFRLFGDEAGSTVTV